MRARFIYTADGTRNAPGWVSAVASVASMQRFAAFDRRFAAASIVMVQIVCRPTLPFPAVCAHGVDAQMRLPSERVFGK